MAALHTCNCPRCCYSAAAKGPKSPLLGCGYACSVHQSLNHHIRYPVFSLTHTLRLLLSRLVPCHSSVKYSEQISHCVGPEHCTSSSISLNCELQDRPIVEATCQGDIQTLNTPSCNHPVFQCGARPMQVLNKMQVSVHSVAYCKPLRCSCLLAPVDLINKTTIILPNSTVTHKTADATHQA